MSQVRVHNFSISLDGFGTGQGLSLEAPFGHAGERLHEWMFATRFWHSKMGEGRGSTGVDDSFAERIDLGFGAEIRPREVRLADRAVGRRRHRGRVAGLVGAEPAVPHPGVRDDAPHASAHRYGGGTVFHFVDGGLSEVLEQARERPVTSTCASAAARRSCASSPPG